MTAVESGKDNEESGEGDQLWLSGGDNPNSFYCDDLTVVIA